MNFVTYMAYDAVAGGGTAVAGGGTAVAFAVAVDMMMTTKATKKITVDY